MLALTFSRPTDAEGVADWVGMAVLVAIVLLPIVVGLIWRAVDRRRDR